MKRHPSDRHIKNQLEHHQTPVDAEQLWAAIEPVVQPKQGSRKWLFLILFFGITAAALSALLFLQNKNSVPPTLDDPAISSPSTNQTQASLIPADPIKDQQQSLESSDAIIDKSTTTITHPLTTNEHQLTTTTNKSTQANNNKTTKLPTANLFSLREKEKNAHSTTPNKVNKNNKFTITDHKPQNSLVAQPTNPVNPQETKATPTNLNKTFTPVVKIATLDYILLDKPLPQVAPPSNRIPPPTISRLGYTPWSVTARIGIGSTLQDLSTKSDSLRTYKSARELSEEQLETFNIEFGLQWTSKQHWYLRSGLGYRQTTERFSFSSESTETVVNDNGITRIILAPNGDTLGIDTGRVTGTRTITQQKTTYNRYRFLEIPVIAGYNFGEGPFSFGVEAGVVPQFLFQIKGEIQNPEGEFISLETVSETQLAWSLHGAFNINYAINDQWQVQLSPVFRYQFTNLHQAEYPLELSYHSLGAQLGLRYAW